MSFETLLIDTCDIYSFTAGAQDAYGNPAKTWAISYASENCRINSAKGREIKVGAEVVIADYILYVGDITVSAQDRVVYNSETYEIILVESFQDGTGAHHDKLYLRIVK